MKGKYFTTRWLLLAGCLLLVASEAQAGSGLHSSAGFSIRLPIIFNRFDQGIGALEGSVVDATNTLPLNGALVCIDGLICEVTEEDGAYSFPNLFSGRHEAKVQRDGYIHIDQTVGVAGNRTRIVNFAMSPDLAAGEYRVILTWGATPADLDTYFWTPDETYPLVWYDKRGSCDVEPFTCLDIDDRDGYGPETISLIHLADSGTYAYAVYNVEFFKPGIPPITASQARVRLYDADGLKFEYVVPSTGEGGLWYVFDLDAATGELIAKNCITYYPPLPDRPTCLED
jgi:hypothetical protein